MHGPRAGGKAVVNAGFGVSVKPHDGVAENYNAASNRLLILVFTDISHTCTSRRNQLKKCTCLNKDQT